jgi:hypothetical protein
VAIKNLLYPMCSMYVLWFVSTDCVSNSDYFYLLGI